MGKVFYKLKSWNKITENLIWKDSKLDLTNWWVYSTISVPKDYNKSD